jgi:hypothetical protein
MQKNSQSVELPIGSEGGGIETNRGLLLLSISPGFAGRYQAIACSTFLVMPATETVITAD